MVSPAIRGHFMMRRVQLPAKGLSAPSGQAMHSAASPRIAQSDRARGATPVRGPLARAGDTLLAMQRAYGNSYVQRVVSQARTTPAIQPKLTAAPAGDRFEREADRVARQVTQERTGTVGDIRSRMEQTLGHDFSGVRLHNDAHAD